MCESIGIPLNRPWPFIFIGWSGLIPQEILFTDLNLWKTLVVLGLYLNRSDRSVPAGQATVPRPVRPLGQTAWCQFWLSTPISKMGTISRQSYILCVLRIPDHRLKIMINSNSEIIWAQSSFSSTCWHAKCIYLYTAVPILTCMRACSLQLAACNPHDHAWVHVSFFFSFLIF